MSFRNYWTDLLEIVLERVKVYTHCVCEVSQHFGESKDRNNLWNYSSLNTWVALMKQKLNYSQYVEQEQDIFRYVKNYELTKERCHSDWIFPHQCYQWYSGPLSNYVLSLAIYQCLKVFQMLLLNVGMSEISDCPFIHLLTAYCPSVFDSQGDLTWYFFLLWWVGVSWKGFFSFDD